MIQTITHRLSALVLKTPSFNMSETRSFPRISLRSSTTTRMCYFGHVDKHFMKFIRVVYDTMKRDNYISIRIPKVVHVETLLSSLKIHYNRNPLRNDYDIDVVDGKLFIRPCNFVTWSTVLDTEEYQHVAYSETSSMDIEKFLETPLSEVIDYIAKL